MIITNEKIISHEREFEFGKISQIALGEKGRGRELLVLTTPDGCVLEKGLNRNLTISKTRSGKYKVISQSDNEIYLLLSTAGGYTRRGNGTVYKPLNSKNFEVLDRGNGADGIAGRIGSWDVLLIKVLNVEEEGEWLRIRRSGGGYGTDLMVKKKNINRKCYISGKITGYSIEYAEKKFKAASEYVAQLGYEPVNPLDFSCWSKDKSWSDYMRQDIIVMMECDNIFLQADYKSSKGAMLEYNIAKELGMNIIFEK